MYFLSHQTTIKSVTTKDILRKRNILAQALAKLPVSLLILHGSVAQNNYKTLSDVDFAVLFKKDNYKLKDIGKTHDLLGKILNREDIDLAVLNKASPLLCMQVLCKGKIIYAAKDKNFMQFREETIRRYLQTKNLRTLFHNYQKQAVLGKA